jgi:DNA-binding Lrp family transcriptional regulator
MSTANNTRNNGKRKAKPRKFYLIRPKHNANIDELADRLISLKNVEEVLVTDGDYGFIVKTNSSKDKDYRNTEHYIQRKIDNKFGSVTVYYQYKK